MELKSKTIRDIKNLIANDQEIYYKENFYKELYEILKEDIEILKDVKFYCNDNVLGVAKTTNLLHIQLNPKNVFYYVRNSFGIYDFDDVDIAEMFKEYSLVVIFHEIIHIQQNAYAIHNYSKYDEINKLYRTLFQKMYTFILYKKIYSKYGLNFFNERNANLEAHNILLQLLPDEYSEFIKDCFLKYYFMGYKEKRDDKVICPARWTFNKILSNYNISSDGIPKEQKLLHGLDLNMEEYILCIKYPEQYQDNEPAEKIYSKIYNHLKN